MNGATIGTISLMGAGAASSIAGVVRAWLLKRSSPKRRITVTVRTEDGHEEELALTTRLEEGQVLGALRSFVQRQERSSGQASPSSPETSA